jgi:hypothetical protein
MPMPMPARAGRRAGLLIWVRGLDRIHDHVVALFGAEPIDAAQALRSVATGGRAIVVDTEDARRVLEPIRPEQQHMLARANDTPAHAAKSRWVVFPERDDRLASPRRLIVCVGGPGPGALDPHTVLRPAPTGGDAVFSLAVHDSSTTPASAVAAWASGEQPRRCIVTSARSRDLPVLAELADEHAASLHVLIWRKQLGVDPRTRERVTSVIRAWPRP